ncbi:MAG TPA: transglutaminase family protein [Steroidobacteraceae bacterium]|jgi:transglutaminase-like putative cysteine protease
MSAVHYAVRHETLYRYQRDVAHAHQQLRLTPREHQHQHTLMHHLQIDPQPAVMSEYPDAFGNTVTRVELDRPHQRLLVVADMQLRVDAPQAVDLDAGDSWVQVRDQLGYVARLRDEPWLEALRFRSESPYVRIKRAFADYAAECLSPAASVASVSARLMAKIQREFIYAPGSTDIATPLLQVLARRTGVCQDFAHLMIACLRSVGLSARYVSGYLRTQGAEPQRGADASHAWVAVFAPPLGWLGFDPTNNLCVQQQHLGIAWGRDFGDVSPLRGVILGGGAHQLNVHVSVRQIDAPN